jgi:hypothetical protein
MPLTTETAQTQLIGIMGPLIGQQILQIIPMGIFRSKTLMPIFTKLELTYHHPKASGGTSQEMSDPLRRALERLSMWQQVMAYQFQSL